VKKHWLGGIEMDIKFTYLAQPPKKFTFEQPKLKKWTESWCGNGKTLNLFAGKTLLSINEVRVDINKNMPAHYHMDALDFIKQWSGGLFDAIILDPPYNIRKGREKYHVDRKTYYKGMLTLIKEEIHNILKTGGIVISFGYDSVGMSKSRGFKKIGICMVCHGGDHNDTICLVEKFISKQRSLLK
jgi:hypothetical protein